MKDQMTHAEAVSKIAALAEEIAGLRALISEAADFWSHYSCVNEGEQDDMNEERLSMLERMNAAGHNA